MNEFLNSLNRLYANEKITKEQLQSMCDKGSVTAEEYKQITGEDYTPSTVNEYEEYYNTVSGAIEGGAV